MVKKIISVFLFIAILSCSITISYAGEVQASLYSVYGDGMLFKQNDAVVFAGTGKPGTAISATLFNSSKALVRKGNTVVNTDGVFLVSFVAPAGGFEEYSIVLTADLQEFAKLENIVFGELWLASGQSNMMYPLAQEKSGKEMMARGEKLSKWLRVLVEPAYPEYNGSSELVPLDAQNDIKDAKWITGEDDGIYGMSAVAYFFAESMLKKLNMPVGILNSSLGGSTIASWLSRDAIDNCADVKNILSNHGRYIEIGDWNEAEQNIYHDMTANFNLRTNALKNFRLSGMIWYQGESDLMFGYSPEEYTAQLELLQSFYTDHFNYNNGLLPLIYAQLAPYMYSDNGFNLIDWNIEYSKFRNEAPDSRAVVTNYDIPSTFTADVGAIHPECKEEIGKRMAYAADGLVYGKYNSYSAPYPKHIEIADSSVFVTFSDVGDGLAVNGNTLHGFAICDSRGIFVQANAEIINKDTVRVYSDSITTPTSVTYAYCVGNYRSNLFATQSNNQTIPASPFKWNVPENANYWVDKPWTDCDDILLWHNYSDTYGSYYKSWYGENAKVNIESVDAFSGENGLNIISSSETFAVKPKLTYKNAASTENFDEADDNYTDYGTISFYVRNNGAEDVTFDRIELYTNSLSYYTSADFKAVTIPADGNWHTISVSLNTLVMSNDMTKQAFSNNVLNEVKDIKFVFSSRNSANISMDNIRFDAESEEENATSPFYNLFEKINSFITFIISLIKMITG